MKTGHLWIAAAITIVSTIALAADSTVTAPVRSWKNWPGILRLPRGRPWMPEETCFLPISRTTEF